MNTIIKYLHFGVLLIAAFTGYGQTLPKPEITPGGLFDNVYDNYGNLYSLSELRVTSLNPMGRSAPTSSCLAGYFNIYFAGGSCFDGSSSAAASKRTVLCQLFTDISSLIAPATNTVRVNIYCADTPTNAPSTLGTAGPFYVFPSSPSNSNPGVIYNQIQKSIITGQDAYVGLPTNGIVGASNFYHGIVNANPNVAWNYNLNSTTIPSNEFDFYTIMLHEVTHALGFASLIDANGFSRFGSNNNYFSSYDSHLYTSAGLPLLAGSSNSCLTSYLSFQTSTAVLAPSCNSNTPAGITTCSTGIRYTASTNTVNVVVSTPGCFSAGTSLSHFEDQCSTPLGYFNTCSTTASPINSFNNLYYVMSDLSFSGSCYVKRHYTEEERLVLCELGYSLNNTLTSPVAGASHTYNSNCSSPNIYGLNDGIVNNVFQYSASVSVTNVISVPLALILQNDGNASQVSCYEVVYANTASVSIVGSNLNITSLNGYSGLVIVKYLPMNSVGEVGNATYVFSYFMPGNCNSANACNMVQNGGFESTSTAGSPCGAMAFIPGSAAVGCWDVHDGTPEIFRRGCGANYNLGTNTHSTVPPIDSHNLSPNNAVAGFGGSTGGSEVLVNSLFSPLVPNSTYQISFWALNPPYPQLTNTTSPLVISVASNSVFAYTSTALPYPNGETILSEFIVPTSTLWAQYTNTFVFNPSPSINHSSVLFGVDVAKTFTIGQLGPNGVYYCLIDDVEIIPIPSPNPIFLITNANTCGNSTFTNLSQFATIPGIFSGPAISTVIINNAIQYNFNSAQTLTPGVYPIGFTYTNNGCVNTIYQNITVSSTVNLNVGSTPYCINTGIPGNITANVSGTIGATYNWLPGNYFGPTHTVVPNNATTYTVFATTNSCITQGTIAVNVSSTCCTYTQNTFQASVLTSMTYTGSFASNGNLKIPTGVTTVLIGEFMFAPNTKITVYPGANLILKAAHLYACSNTMWDGIEILDGGKVNTDPGNLIEDAQTGIKAVNQFTNGICMDIKNTVFNKNYIDISISKANCVSGSPALITDCVFTCRDLPFTSTTWPTAGTSSVGTGVTAELRYANSTMTTGLSSPYFVASGFTITNLKAPHNTHPSQTAIYLLDVGTTLNNSFTGIFIGSNNGASEFNLFDAHGDFINSTHSNIQLMNNVFQNTQFYYAVEGGPGSNSIYTGGRAIMTDNGIMNTALTMTATSFDLGNRFWNCHTAVNASNVLRFNFTKGIIRSTQSTATITGIQPGNTGLFLATNRFQYEIKDNEFTNINTCIHIPIAAGAYTSIAQGTVNGIYGHKINIQSNTLSAGTSTSNYISHGIRITSPNNSPITYAPDFTISPNTKGIIVQNNTLTSVYRGIYLMGITGFESHVRENLVDLTLDNVFNGTQHGIDLSNTMSANNVPVQFEVSTNTVTGSATTSMEALYYNSLNFGLQSPVIRCNSAANSYQGFVFSGRNTPTTSLIGTQWFGNSMANLNRGMVLTTNGEIGAQGSSLIGSGNAWIGAAWTNTANYHTWTQSSFAQGSPIFYAAGAASLNPSNNDGVPTLGSYSISAPSQVISGANYSCSDPSARSSTFTSNNDGYDALAIAIKHIGLYRFLSSNDSVRNAEPSLTAFFNDQTGSNIETLSIIEGKLYEGDYAGARSLLSGFSSNNAIETNYFDFYTLFANYQDDLDNAHEFSSADSSALLDLSNLCPEISGACIFQARALYELIYQATPMYDACADGTGARPSVLDKDSSKTLLKEVEYQIAPNPANGFIKLTGPFNINAKLIIIDATGRKIVEKKLKLENSSVIISIDLINGLYDIVIGDEDGRIYSKKLIVTE